VFAYTYKVDFMAVQIKTRRVAVGDRQNVSVLVEDLELLKRLKHEDEDSLAVTFHRIIEAAEMYDAIMKAGEGTR
jgi:hypothetical protein